MCQCEHGICSGGACLCEPRWLGTNCQVSTEVEARLPFFIAYQVIFAVIFWVLTGYVARQLMLVIEHQGKKNVNTSAYISGQGRLSAQTICLLTLLFSALIRAFYYSIDPNSWRGILAWQADGLFVNAPIMLILVAFCINLIVWMRMQIQFADSTADFSVRFVSFQPYILMAVSTVYPIIVLTEETLYAVNVASYNVTLWIYNLSTAFVLVYLVACALYFGGKVMSFLKRTRAMSVSSNSSSTFYSKGLLNMTKLVIGGSINGAIVAVLLITATIVQCGPLRIGYCIPLYHTSFRIPEIISVLLIVSAITGTATNGKRSAENSSTKQIQGGTSQRTHKSHKSQKSLLIIIAAEGDQEQVQQGQGQGQGQEQEQGQGQEQEQQQGQELPQGQEQQKQEQQGQVELEQVQQDIAF